MTLVEIIIKGSMERLNAILMTALTSALGLAPMVLQGGAGQELLQPLSIVVFGGLFTSTAITLVFYPLSMPNLVNIYFRKCLMLKKLAPSNFLSIYKSRNSMKFHLNFIEPRYNIHAPN